MLAAKTYRGPCPLCRAPAWIEELCAGEWVNAGDFGADFVIRCERCDDLCESDPTAELAVARAKEIAANRHSYKLRKGQLWPV